MILTDLGVKYSSKFRAMAKILKSIDLILCVSIHYLNKFWLIWNANIILHQIYYVTFNKC